MAVVLAVSPRREDLSVAVEVAPDARTIRLGEPPSHRPGSESALELANTTRMSAESHLRAELGWGALLEEVGHVLGRGAFGEAASHKAKCDDTPVVVKTIFKPSAWAFQSLQEEVKYQREAAALGVAPKVFLASTDLPDHERAQRGLGALEEGVAERAMGLAMEKAHGTLQDLIDHIHDWGWIKRQANAGGDQSELRSRYHGRSERYDKWRGNNRSRGYRSTKRAAAPGERLLAGHQ